jgi:hypothetical protein
MYELGLADRGSIPDRENKFFFILQRPDRLWVHPVSHKMGTGSIFPGVKW